ncbi:MAG: hypothetical protein ACI3V4_02615 [Faecousia sp.]
MSVKTEFAERLRREKAKNLRYKRAISADLNLETITSSLWEMQETASNIRWWYTQGDETMLDELIGDEEESYELKMAFSTLDADCYQMIEDLNNQWIPECFDAFFGAITPGRMMGFDSYEGDYFGLDDGYETELAQREAQERLKRYTKDQLIDAFRTCFRVVVNYINIRNRYDGLQSYIDILNGQNTGFLATVKRIEDLYEKVADGHASWDDRKEFDSLINNMPDEVWVQ